MNFIESSKNIFKELVSVRRELHKNPELSFSEFKTQEFILNYLDKLGIKAQKIAGTGVLGTIGNSDKCVALRADIDALALEELTDCSFVSQNKGVMHACGHDMHISMLLGAAKILKDNESELKGSVKLLFQPGEEKAPGGAVKMLKEGALENPIPLAVFGQHTDPGTSTGSIALAPGYIMASADELYFNITGKSTHAAQPHLGSDPILTGAQLVMSLQTLITKFKNPLKPGVITIGAFNGGTVNNIIPETVDMKGTIRSFDLKWRNDMLVKIEQITRHICSLYETKCKFWVEECYPPVFNHTETTEFINEIGAEMLGKDKVDELEPKMWAEDFAYYSQKVPATFWYVGIKPEDKKSIPPLHSQYFNPDENAMIYGTAMLASAAYNYLIKK